MEYTPNRLGFPSTKIMEREEWGSCKKSGNTKQGLARDPTRKHFSFPISSLHIPSAKPYHGTEYS